ncbi:hypothetical protein [Collimonas sp.]|uniref:hypothetical protein n=1 Tax=Collimonas sp. TaxID=1963772 RepID=UPI002B537A7D|nr:hypothetical protein [Collimonas sp.]HWX02786.1 hypothetical protein [Collimonas sp.]
MKPQFNLAACLIVFLAGCSTPPAPAPGSDRDEHGCIASAGYSWCTGTNQCERPWELSQKNGLDKSREAFNEFCKNPSAKQ